MQGDIALDDAATGTLMIIGGTGSGPQLAATRR